MVGQVVDRASNRGIARFPTGSMFLIRNKVNGPLAPNGPAVL